MNCAGGRTPWGTWLSCEEVDSGQVFECDPLGQKPAVARPALGVFKHEAAAVDPANHHVYLSEDQRSGRFYRFVPASVGAGGIPDLGQGKLQVAEVQTGGAVVWHDLPDPQFTRSTPTREQIPASTAFAGGEGLAYLNGIVYLSTKGDNRIWAYDIAQAKLSVLYDPTSAANPMLSGVDNVTVTCCGDVLVAEDGGDMEVVVIMPNGTLKPLLQVTGQSMSEITGIAFDPSGTRLYMSSQRTSLINGTTYEISGPFHVPG